MSDQVDRTRTSILYRYAAYANATLGEFSAARHLTEEHLVSYWHSGCRDLTPRSRDKALSTLRTIAARSRFADGLLMRRPPTSAPYDETSWQTFRAAARHLVDPAVRQEADMLLDLSGETGLRGAEINRVTGHHLTVRGEVLTVTISAAGAARTIPVTADVADRLMPLAGRAECLLRPHYKNRKNAVSSLITMLALRNPVFDGFRAAAARHRWIAQLLSNPIDLVSVLYLCGLEGDSHTIHDIRAHLPAADPTSARRAYLDARRSSFEQLRVIAGDHSIGVQ